MKTYIQIGSNIGNDDFQKEIEFLTEPSFIILVEPNIRLLNELKSNYESLKTKHKIIFCDRAISLKEQETKLYIYLESGHSSLIKRKSHMRPIEEMSVKSITFNDLCETFSINEIELLQIDTEGLDYEIVNSIDFSQIKINKLIFELWGHPDDDLNGVYRTGYEFFDAELRDRLLRMYDSEVVWLSNMPNYKLTLKK